MTARALFAGLAAKLNEQEFGTKFRDENGLLKDTGVQKLADTIRDYAVSGAPIEISEPIQIYNPTGGPTFVFNNTGDSVKGIEMWDAEGRYSSFGIGLGNEGIVANQLIALPNYAVDLLVAHCVYSNMGAQGGTATLRPNDPRVYSSFWSGGGNPGIGLTNDKDCAVGSGYGIEQSGSGYRYDVLGGNDTFVVETAIPANGGGGGGTGGTGTGGAYGTITSVAGDTVTVTLLSGASVVAAKPYYLRQSTFDGETVGGITYSYSDSQTRTADDGSNTVGQSVLPAYTAGDGILLVETPDGNGVSGTTHMDVNSDGRYWSETPESC